MNRPTKLWICGVAVGMFLGVHAAGARDFAYEDLVQLIQGHNLARLEDLLPLLPENLRANYTLMHDSRSLQEATFTSPRVILFGDNARLTCAFNGDVVERGFDTLECFQFRQEERAFDFRQIQFPSSDNGQMQVEFSERNLSVDGKVSCTSCHGSDPRPNWDGYALWPGAYGAHDDEIRDDDDSYAAFVKARSAHSRYRWLIQGGDALEPYSDSAADAGRRPNLRFSDFVGRMNSYRASRILESKVAAWETLEFASGALGCTLTQDQIERLAQAGLSYPANGNMDAIFGKLGLSPSEWSTQISGDAEVIAGPPYEHQAGFGSLTRGVAMAVVAEKAFAGDAILQDALTRILAPYSSPPAPPGSTLAFFQALNAMLPDPSYFGSAYPTNTGHICPELTELFIQAILHGKPHVVASRTLVGKDSSF